MLKSEIFEIIKLRRLLREIIYLYYIVIFYIAILITENKKTVKCVDEIYNIIVK